MPPKRTFRKRISQLAGKIAGWRKPYWFVKAIIRFSTRVYKIKLNDFEFELKKGVSFHDFFTRKLKIGVRPIMGNFVSPVDCRLTSFGPAHEGTMIQAKGMRFSFHDLIDCTQVLTEPLCYAVFYLSPADYHRFHAPFDMKIEEVKHIPGDLFSVKPKSTLKHENLFCINERVVLSGDSEFGRFWLVLIGALMVGSVKLNFSPITTNLHKRKKINSPHLTEANFNAGDELGYFSFGSTVVVCMQNESLAKIKCKIGNKLNMGENLF